MKNLSEVMPNYIDLALSEDEPDFTTSDFQQHRAPGKNAQTHVDSVKQQKDESNLTIETKLRDEL